MNESMSQADSEKVKRCIEWLKDEDLDTDLFFDMDISSYLEKINALSVLFNICTGRDLKVDNEQDVTLELNLELNGDREFLAQLQGVKLPDLYGLKCINFYEYDSDLENLLNEQLTSVQCVHLAAEGYMVDSNDYLISVLKLSCLKNLYLDGFLVDSDGLERCFTHSQLQILSFFSCNLGVEDEFFIDSDNDTNVGYGYSRQYSLILTLHIESTKTTKKPILLLVRSKSLIP